MSKSVMALVALPALLVVGIACTTVIEVEVTSVPTATPLPTYTPYPTYTPPPEEETEVEMTPTSAPTLIPTASTTPTSVPEPTKAPTPIPTSSLPPAPRSTSTPRPTATATKVPRATIRLLDPTITPTATSIPTLPTSVPYFSPSDEELRLGSAIHAYVNAVRVQAGLSELEHDGLLARAARGHSVDMGVAGYFSDTGLDGRGPTERAADVGFVCHKDFGTYYVEGVGENIFQGSTHRSYYISNGERIPQDPYTLKELAKVVVEAWLNNREHRENILDSTYDKEGIGLHITADKEVYVTQNFC